MSTFEWCASNGRDWRRAYPRFVDSWKRRSPPSTPGAPVALCPHHHRQEPSMKEQPTDKHPLSDLAYDWITLIQNKAQALMAYDQYIQDAEQAKSPECAAFFRKVHDL